MSVEPAQGGRGYHRVRAQDLAPVVFNLEGHRFETSGRDLWVTLEGEERIDRIKVTRSTVSRSAQSGYPRELLWPRTELNPDLAGLMGRARFWLGWRSTPDAAAHPAVSLDHYVRSREAQLAAASG